MNLGQGTCSPQGPRHFVHASLQVRPGLTELVFSLADFCSRHMQLRQQRPESSALTSSLRFPGGIELYKATLAQVQSPKAEEESGAVWACLSHVQVLQRDLHGLSRRCTVGIPHMQTGKLRLSKHTDCSNLVKAIHGRTGSNPWTQLQSVCFCPWPIS